MLRQFFSIQCIRLFSAVVFLTLLSSPPSHADDWIWQNPLPTGEDVQDVWGAGSSDVFAVGIGGTVLHYDGSSWTTMDTGTLTHFNGIWGSSGSDVFAVGFSGAILHYDGSSWSAMTSGTTSSLYCVWGSGVSDVFVGGYQTILHYDGSNWSPMTLPVGFYGAVGIWGTSGSDVFAVGSGGSIIHYDGSSWSAMTSGTASLLNDVWGSSGSDVFVVGQNGVILHYDGSSWSTMVSGTTQALQGVWGSSGTDVYAVGYNGALHYDGTAWSAIDPGSTTSLLDVWGSNGSDVFIVGFYGTIFHFDGSSWTAMSSGSLQDIEDLWIYSPTDIFAVGMYGTILHYDGTAWSEQASGTATQLNGVWGSSGNDVFAAGADGLILHYDGVSWSAMTTGSTASFVGVWGTDGANVYAVGESGTILHYDGSSWSPMPSGTSQLLMGIWGSNNNDIFAVGYSGTIVHFNGSAWTTMTSGTTTGLLGVWGSMRHDVFAVGYTGTILHYNGSSWATQSSGTTQHLEDVWGQTGSHVFAVGWNRTVRQYDGASWSPVNTGGAIVLSAIKGIDNHVFTAGRNGTIRYYNDPYVPPPITCFEDLDGDGYGSANGFPEADGVCDTTQNESYFSTDCNDADASIYPAAVEAAGDEIDQNCDGGELCYADQDDDGYRPDGTSTVASDDVDCADSTEAILSDPTGDCDDTDAGVYPGATEIVADGVDQDCNSSDLCYLDADGDIYGTTATVGDDGDFVCNAAGESAVNSDCNDADAGVNPGAIEIVADGVDQDCNDGELCYADQDDDGYRPDASSTVSSADLDCTDPTEATSADPTGDCDDTDAGIHPGATEIVGDGVDQDCNGSDLCYLDADGDTYGTTATVADDGDFVCNAAGESAVNTDCNDANATINPGAVEEVGDEIDQDCNGGELCYADQDDDGFRPDGTSAVVSSDPDCKDTTEAISSDQIDDCNDSDPAVHPGAAEIVADGTDQDCSGRDRCYQDADGDTYGTTATVDDDGNFVCSDPGEASVSTDCDDGDADIHPAAREICDAKDNNCNGYIDEYGACSDGFWLLLLPTIITNSAQMNPPGAE